jgi:hypothetical protein
MSRISMGRIYELLFQEPTTKISAPNLNYYGSNAQESEVRFSSFYMENQKCSKIICVGYFQNGLKPFSCYVKVSYATKVIE